MHPVSHCLQAQLSAAAVLFRYMRSMQRGCGQARTVAEQVEQGGLVLLPEVLHLVPRLRAQLHLGGAAMRMDSLADACDKEPCSPWCTALLTTSCPKCLVSTDVRPRAHTKPTRTLQVCAVPLCAAPQ